jgi:glutathione S-transferase
MQRRAKAEVAAAPSAAQVYGGVRSKPRGPGDEWKGMVANLLCVGIGCIVVLCIQSYMGTLGEKPRGWIMSNVTLRYFELRGRAEGIRLFLEDIGQPYRDVRYTREEWQAVKNDTSLFPYNQLPQLDDSGISVVQTYAIMRHIARAYNLGGDTDFEQTMADVVAGGVEDLRIKYGKIAYAEDFSQEKLKKHTEEVLPVALRQFEDLLGRLGKTYFVGSGITYADYLVYDIVDIHRRAAPQCLRPFPLLGNWFHTMSARTRLHAYLRSERRPKYVNGNSAFFDNQKAGPAVQEEKKSEKKVKAAAATKTVAAKEGEDATEF